MIYFASLFSGVERPHGFLQGLCCVIVCPLLMKLYVKEHVQDLLTFVFEHRYAFDLKKKKKSNASNSVENF